MPVFVLVPIAFAGSLVYGLTGFGSGLITVPLAGLFFDLPFVLAVFALIDGLNAVRVWTTIASAHGVVHDAGVPRPPSTSTRQSRHDPKAARVSVAHRRGMSTPASAAARMTEVPSGTVTARPSMVRLT